MPSPTETLNKHQGLECTVKNIKTSFEMKREKKGVFIIFLKNKKAPNDRIVTHYENQLSGLCLACMA